METDSHKILSKKTFRTPTHMTISNVRDFLKEIETVFLYQKYGKKGVQNVYFQTKQTQKIDILGALLIYKFIEYTVKSGCFFDPQWDLLESRMVREGMNRYGFGLSNSPYIRDSNGIEAFIPPFSKYDENTNWFYAPVRLNKNDPNIGVKVTNEKKINRFYYDEPLIQHCIIQCISEISTNFQAHTEDDTESVIVAQGSRTYFEIACADNGIGILTSLRQNQEYRKYENFELLEKSLNNGVSSKPNSMHMGRGLWYIYECVKRTCGQLIVFSQDQYFKYNNSRIKKGDSPYWKGTILYIKINLNKIQNIQDFLKSQTIKYRRLTKTQ